MDTQDIPHLLVVEDEPLTRALLVSYFQQEGYRVSEAENGDSVLALLAEDPVDVVLLDIKLPGKDGLTLARELRTHSDIGIILITCKDSEIDRIVGLELGADVYVTKPFNPRELLAQVKNLLRRVRASQTRDEPNSGRRNGGDPHGINGETRLGQVFRRLGFGFQYALVDFSARRVGAADPRRVAIAISLYQ